MIMTKNIQVLSAQNNITKLAVYHYDSSKNIKIGELGLRLNNEIGWSNCWSPRELYITSDEEIKEGDWCLSKLNELVLLKKNYTNFNYKKIILTTDQDLIKNGVQAIDDEFLEWFVKNPSCEFVEIEKEHDDTVPYLKMRYCKPYKIIIPKEEVKETIYYCKQGEPTCVYPKCICNTVRLKEESKQELIEGLKKGKYYVVTGKSKQETLEEACSRCFEEMKVLNPKGGLKEYIRMAVNFGVKFQAERSYSEEEVKNLIKIIEWYDKESDVRPNYTPDIEERIGEISMWEWFEQFKKK